MSFSDAGVDPSKKKRKKGDDVGDRRWIRGEHEENTLFSRSLSLS